MKRTYLIITALFGTSCMLNAQQTTGVIADNLKIERNGEYMVVDINRVPVVIRATDNPV